MTITFPLITNIVNNKIWLNRKKTVKDMHDHTQWQASENTANDKMIKQLQNLLYIVLLI